MENSNLIEVNRNNIQKALNFLGLDANPFKEIKKGEENNLKSPPEPGGGTKEDIAKPEETKKEEKETKEHELKETFKEEHESNGEESGEESEEEKLEKSKKAKKEDLKEEIKPEEINKAQVNELVKAQVNEITKSLNDTFEKAINSVKESFISEVQVLKTELTKGFQTANEKFKSVGILEKEQMEAINRLDIRIKTIESAPQPRKSVLVSKSHVEKSFDQDNGIEQNRDSNKQYLSLSGNKKEILSILREKSNIDNVTDISQANQLMVKGLEIYESSSNFGSFNKAIISEFEKEGIVFVK